MHGADLQWPMPPSPVRHLHPQCEVLRPEHLKAPEWEGGDVVLRGKQTGGGIPGEMLAGIIEFFHRGGRPGSG